MDFDFGDIACHSNNTYFQVLTNGRKYIFTIPNEAILDYLGETDKEVDCPQYVMESQEIFEEIAEDFISREPEKTEFLIDLETLREYFQ